jgi:DNA ligase D-like protein (predicted polymerase)
MPSAPKRETFLVDGREIALTNPDKVFFRHAGIVKRDLFEYYRAVADGALRGIKNRPIVLKRFPDGIDAPPFFQKRVGATRPEWLETATLSFPSGRTAEELVVNDAAGLLWMINLGCVDLNPHPIRANDLQHPDELRVDLDPVPGVGWEQILEVSKVVKDTLEDLGLRGWPKTSGSRGVHVYVRIEPRWTFDEVRRAALALAREVERRAPAIATSRWWKEERHGVFLDYNQNAKDRTVASAYSVRPTQDARVSMPLPWDELLSCDPAAYTLRTVPALFAARGDAHEGIDDHHGSIDRLLEIADAYDKAGVPDAPWPPHYPKQPGEASRVAPSRARGAPKPSSPRPKIPLVIVAKAETKAEALEGLERWKKRHPTIVPLLAEADYLVDAMRGRFTTWTRIRVNLKNVPQDERPPPEKPDPDYEPTWTHPKGR